MIFIATCEEKKRKDKRETETTTETLGEEAVGPSQSWKSRKHLNISVDVDGRERGEPASTGVDHVGSPTPLGSPGCLSAITGTG